MKQALITGADRGIGYQISHNLGKNGWQIIIGARDKQRAEETITRLKADGTKVIGWQYINLSDNASILESVREIKDKYPEMELLVNNAGIPGNMIVSSYDAELKDIQETIQTNYIGSFYLTKLLIPLLAHNYGRIVNITVPSEVSPYWHPMAYVASKSAQNVMTSIIAMDLDRNHIPVEIFDIHPGATTTDLNNHYNGPGSHMPEIIGKKIEEIINDGKHHQGEFIELYPIVDEGNY